MSLQPNPNRHDSSEFEPPTLGDILQLLYAVEALEPGIRDKSPTERFEIRGFLWGIPHEEGNMIARIRTLGRVGNDAQNFEPVMNYTIVRDGDITTTKVLKRPPVLIGTLGDLDPDSELGRLTTKALIERAADSVRLHDEAEQAGLNRLTANEVRELTKTVILAQGWHLLSEHLDTPPTNNVA